MIILLSIETPEGLRTAPMNLPVIPNVGDELLLFSDETSVLVLVEKRTFAINPLGYHKATDLYCKEIQR